MIYKSAQSVVCVDNQFLNTGNNAAVLPTYFPYFDAVISADKSLFHVTTPAAPFLFQIDMPFGGASTGCNSFPLLNNSTTYCDTVTGDAFYDVYNDPVTGSPITGYWGFLLSLHESINVFTGLTSGGWPTDWWADHRSPFPNAMDAAFMSSIANGSSGLSSSTNSALKAAAQAQLERFTYASNPTGEYDTEVALLVNIFNNKNVFTNTAASGFSGYSNMFALASADGLQWPSVSKDAAYTGDDDYSENLSEYVIAYLHLGFGSTSNATSAFAAAGVGTKDTTIPSYSISPSNVEAIANAHCSIRAAINNGKNASTQLTALQHGNFQSAIASGGAASSCPSECQFVSNACVAKF